MYRCTHWRFREVRLLYWSRQVWDRILDWDCDTAVSVFGKLSCREEGQQSEEEAQYRSSSLPFSQLSPSFPLPPCIHPSSNRPFRISSAMLVMSFGGQCSWLFTKTESSTEGLIKACNKPLKVHVSKCFVKNSGMHIWVRILPLFS